MKKIGRLIGSTLLAGTLLTGCIGVIASSNEPINMPINVNYPAPAVGGYVNGYGVGYGVVVPPVTPMILAPMPGQYIPPTVSYAPSFYGAVPFYGGGFYPGIVGPMPMRPFHWHR